MRCRIMLAFVAIIFMILLASSMGEPVSTSDITGSVIMPVGGLTGILLSIVIMSCVFFAYRRTKGR